MPPQCLSNTSSLVVVFNPSLCSTKPLIIESVAPSAGLATIGGEDTLDAKEAASAPPVDDEPIAMAIKEMGGVAGLPDISLGMEDIEVLA